MIAEIQRRAAAGAVMRNADMPAGMRRAAVNLLGGWHAALVAAGVGDKWIASSRSRWTRDSVIAEIKRRAAAGMSLRNQEMPVVMRRAAVTLFGGWYAALVAAGVGDRSLQLPRWSRALIVAELRRYLATTTRPRRADLPVSLQGACGRYFGSWRSALAAARSRDPQPNTPPTLPTAQGRIRWSAERVLADLRRILAVLPTPRMLDVPGPLRKASLTFFGTWNAALAAARGDAPEVVLTPRQRRFWTREQIIDILHIHAANRRAVTGPHLIAACKLRFGSVDAAQDAAGLGRRIG